MFCLFNRPHFLIFPHFLRLPGLLRFVLLTLLRPLFLRTQRIRATCLILTGSTLSFFCEAADLLEAPKPRKIESSSKVTKK